MEVLNNNYIITTALILCLVLLCLILMVLLRKKKRHTEQGKILPPPDRSEMIGSATEDLSEVAQQINDYMFRAVEDICYCSSNEIIE